MGVEPATSTLARWRSFAAPHRDGCDRNFVFTILRVFSVSCRKLTTVHDRDLEPTRRFLYSELSSGGVHSLPFSPPELKVARSNRAGRTIFSSDLADPSFALDP
jgi:hypothetical protein